MTPEDTTRSGAWEFGTYYAPLAVIILVTTFCWVMVLYKVLQVNIDFLCFCVLTTQVSNRMKTSSYIVQTTIGILLFLVSLVLQFIHRVINVVDKDNDPFSWNFVHALTNSSIGIFVFLIFGSTYDNFMLYRDLCNCTVRSFEPNIDEVSFRCHIPFVTFTNFCSQNQLIPAAQSLLLHPLPHSTSL